MDKKINRKLIAAYAKLIKKETKRITVSLLCEKADVARATFYIHYKDLDDFIAQLHRYIVDVFFEQAIMLLSCSEKDFEKAVKKENLLFNESELTVLRNMISDTNYIDFALLADDYYTENQINSVFPEKIQEKYQAEINIFLRGYFPILILGITDYKEVSFSSDIRNCRMLFRYLCDEILKI